jgi:hypothetical protein
MQFCPVVPEICRGQVHASWKERIIIIIIKITIRNGAKTTSPPKINYIELFEKLDRQVFF